MKTGRQAQPHQVFSKDVSSSDLEWIFDVCIATENENQFVKLGDAQPREWGGAFTAKLATLFVERPDIIEHQNAVIKQVLNTTIPEFCEDHAISSNVLKFFEWLKEKQENAQENETITLFTIAMQLSRLEDITIQKIDTALLLTIASLSGLLPNEGKIKASLQSIVALNLLKHEDAIKKNCLVKNEVPAASLSRKRKKCDMEEENALETVSSKVSHFLRAIENKDYFRIGKFLKDKKILQVLIAEDQKILNEVSASQDKALLKLFLSHLLSRMPMIRIALRGIIASNNVTFIKAMSENFTLDLFTFEMGIIAALMNESREITQIMWDHLRKQVSSAEEIRKQRESIAKQLSMIVPPAILDLIERELNALPDTPLVVSESEHSHEHSIDDFVNAFFGMSLKTKEEGEQETFSDQDLEAVLSPANSLMSNFDKIKDGLARENGKGKEKEEMEVEPFHFAFSGF